MIHAVLFDMDGVLVDSFEAWARLMNATAQHFSCPPVDRERFRSVYGQPTTEDIRAFFPGQTVESVENFYNQHFSDYVDHVQAAPGASDVVRTLQGKGIVTATVTNTINPLATHILQRLGIETGLVIGANDVPAPKPDPSMLLLACQRLGVAPSESLMVGDSRYDQAAAAAAGVRFAGIGVGGDTRLKRLADVLMLLEETEP